VSGLNLIHVIENLSAAAQRVASKPSVAVKND